MACTTDKATARRLGIAGEGPRGQTMVLGTNDRHEAGTRRRVHAVTRASVLAPGLMGAAALYPLGRRAPLSASCLHLGAISPSQTRPTPLFQEQRMVGGRQAGDLAGTTPGLPQSDRGRGDRGTARGRAVVDILELGEAARLGRSVAQVRNVQRRWNARPGGPAMNDTKGTIR
jgi:hypothetical protein